MDNKLETFGDRLLRLRENKNLSQAQLAKKIGSSKGTIQNYEADSLPKGEFAIKLAEFFECSIDYLLTGKSFPYIKGEEEKKSDNSSNLTRLVVEHQDMVKKFKDPERAKNINERLIDIEDASDDLYDKVDTYLRGVHDAARVIKGSSKKKNKNQELSTKKQVNGN